MPRRVGRGIALLGMLFLAGQLKASVPAAFAQSSPSARTEQRAFSSWARHGSTFFVEATKSVDPEGDSLGVLGQIGCSSSSLCLGALVVKEIPTQAFTFDPGLGSATLEMTWAGAPQVIEWIGEGAPTAESGDADNPGVAAARSAEATGSFLSQDFEATDEPSDASLAQEGRMEDDSNFPTYPSVSIGVSDQRSNRDSADHTLSNGNDCISFKNTERRFARLINKERNQNGNNKLTLDTELGKAARKHTGEMIDKALLHHTSSADLVTRIVGWTVLGENVGVGGTVESLHDAFMASPPHKKNILYSSYRHFGIGVAKGDGRTWVTVIFQAKEDPGTTLNCAA